MVSCICLTCSSPVALLPFSIFFPLFSCVTLALKSNFLSSFLSLSTPLFLYPSYISNALFCPFFFTSLDITSFLPCLNNCSFVLRYFFQCPGWGFGIARKKGFPENYFMFQAECSGTWDRTVCVELYSYDGVV